MTGGSSKSDGFNFVAEGGVLPIFTIDIFPFLFFFSFLKKTRRLRPDTYYLQTAKYTHTPGDGGFGPNSPDLVLPDPVTFPRPTKRASGSIHLSWTKLSRSSKRG